MIDELIKGVLAREGGYVNDPRDSGGETNLGITVAVARANGYSGSMKELTKEKAADIYKRQYFIRPKFDEVSKRYPKVADELFDTGINMGPGVAAKFLQRCLNVQDGITIGVDGAIGQGTLAALDTFKAKRGAAGEGWLLKALDALQGARYIELAENSVKNEAFVYGWIANRLGNA